MKKFLSLRLTLPEWHLDASDVAQKRFVDLHAAFSDIDDLSEVAQLTDIIDYLKVHNRTRMTFQQRANRCHHLIQQIIISSDSLQEALPLNLLSVLHAESGYAVKLLLEGLDDHHLQGKTQYLHWLLYTLGQQISSHFAAYFSDPKNLWGELHRTYQYILDNKLGDSVSEPLKQTLSQTYQSIVFFAAAQPHHFNPTESRILLQWLRRWVPLDAMSHQTSRTTSEHFFYVNLLENGSILSDKRLQHYLINDNSILVATPIPLIELAKHHIGILKATGKPISVNITLDVDHIDVIATLKKAINIWGKIASRKENRVASYESIELVVGLPYVLKVLDSHAEHRPNAISGLAVNTSRRGTCIELNGRDGIHANVGDIVNQHSAAKNSIVGVVKWVRRSQEMALLGVEYILGDAHPVVTTLTDHWVSALLMRDDKNEVLLTRSGIYRPNQELRMSDPHHQKTLVAKLGPLLNRFGDTDAFRVTFER